MADKRPLRVGLVVPHIFMHPEVLPRVIFSPAELAQGLASGLKKSGVDVTLFTPGPIKGNFKNITADLSYFEAELEARGDNYLDLLKKHPFTFITLARQVQGEIIAHAFKRANDDKLDVIHIYGNEEELALPFASLCHKPVVFTHHDPFNFLVKYRSIFPKYKHLNWLSLSMAQRRSMPAGTNWVANIYHGLDPKQWQPSFGEGQYVAYLGRIIEPKGLHLAIESILAYNREHPSKPLTLKIAGKHYSGETKDSYWQKKIKPALGSKFIEYVGFLAEREERQAFLASAKALVIPSTYDEPFGMVMIEALACGTPLIGLSSGAIPEVIKNKQTGILVTKEFSNQTATKQLDEQKTSQALAIAYEQIDLINRHDCRVDFEQRFTLEKMVRAHKVLYQKLVTK